MALRSPRLGNGSVAPDAVWMSGRRGRPAGTTEALEGFPRGVGALLVDRGAGGGGGGFPEKPEVGRKKELSWWRGREEVA